MHRSTLAVTLILFVLILSCSQTSSATSDETKQDPQAAGPSNVGETETDVAETVTDIAAWTAPEGRAPRFLFVHHSTGFGFMFNGGMAEMLEDSGVEVHSRTYGDGWVGDNTNPDHFPITFTEHFDDLITWDLPDGQQYDIIAFKSCYPASNICSDEELEQYKGYYETVKSVTSEHPEILFVPWSTPPLVPNATELNCAERAEQFADWLMGEYTEDEPNLVAYDVFHMLAGDDESSGDYLRLRYEYQNSADDSHPNHDANVAVAEDFTNWLTRLMWWDI